MSSWKTTLFGAVTALGLYLKNAAGAPDWLHTVGTVLALAGPSLLGYFSRDNNVTSESAGAK